jgi:Protein of unknown function (DUF1572)
VLNKLSYFYTAASVSGFTAYRLHKKSEMIEMTDALKMLYSRDLAKLKTEIELYKDESRLWHIQDGITNSAGNLCLHLTGNLNHFIGATLGNTGYVRNREEEFSLKNIPRAELYAKIDETIAVVNTTLDTLTAEVLDSEYPLLLLDQKFITKHFLLHLTGHLAYHLGQINYHRRLLDR